MTKKKQEIAKPEPQQVAKVPAPAPQPIASLPVELGEAFIVEQAQRFDAQAKRTMASLQLASSRSEMARLRVECERAVAAVEADYTAEQAVLAELFLDGCRPQFVTCFGAVNPAFTATAEGQTRIISLVNTLLEGYKARLRKDGVGPLAS